MAEQRSGSGPREGREKKKPGPEPERLKIEGDWREALKRSLTPDQDSGEEEEATVHGSE